MDVKLVGDKTTAAQQPPGTTTTAVSTNQFHAEITAAAENKAAVGPNDPPTGSMDINGGIEIERYALSGSANMSQNRMVHRASNQQQPIPPISSPSVHVVASSRPPQASVEPSFTFRLKQLADSGINILQPTTYKQLSDDFSTMLTVAGLLVAANYQAIYAGFLPATKSCGRTSSLAPPSANTTTDTCSVCDDFTTFAALNYAAVGLALVAAVLAILGLSVLRCRQPWPEIVAESSIGGSSNDDASVRKVDKAKIDEVARFASALQVIRQAAISGLIPECWQRVVNCAVTLAWPALMAAVVFTLAAASLALRRHSQACDKVFTGLSIPVLMLAAAALVVFLVWLSCGAKCAGGKGCGVTQRAGKCCDVLPTCASPAQPSIGTFKQSLEVIEQHMPGILHAREAAKLPANGVWAKAIDVAKKKDADYRWPSPAALELQGKLASDYNIVTRIWDDLWTWQAKYGDFYAVHAFLDPSLVHKALSHRADLEVFWSQLDIIIENKGMTLEEFFTSGSYGPVWKGRAEAYRTMAEQLDIVNWYYHDKHLDPKNGNRRHYAHNLTRTLGGKLKLREYHDLSSAELAEHKQGERMKPFCFKPTHDPTTPEGFTYGGFEETLVRPSYCRPDRFRLIQEWEARQLLRDANGTYPADDLNDDRLVPNKPKSSLELAVLLQQHLEDKISFKDIKQWPIPLQEAVQLSAASCAGLQEEMASKYAPIANMLEELQVWDDQYSEVYKYWAVYVYKDHKLVTKALKIRAELEAFWSTLDNRIDNGLTSLDSFFTTSSSASTWLGRAKLHRQLAEQLDIVNWYYKKKHIEYRTHYLTDDFLTDEFKAAASSSRASMKFEEAVQEYHEWPPKLTDGNAPAIPASRRGRRLGGMEYGGYEEWLVKGSNSRPDRYRLFQEAEARELLRDKKTMKYDTVKLEQQPVSMPQSTLKLAWLLRMYLEPEPGEFKSFKELKLKGDDADNFVLWCKRKEEAAGAGATSAGPTAG